MKLVILEDEIVVKYNGILVADGGEIPISFDNVYESTTFKFKVYFNGVLQDLKNNNVLVHVNHLQNNNRCVTIKVEIINQATGVIKTLEKEFPTYKYIGFGELANPAYETPLAVLMKEFEQYKLDVKIKLNELSNRIKTLEEEGELL